MCSNKTLFTKQGVDVFQQDFIYETGSRLEDPSLPFP